MKQELICGVAKTVTDGLRDAQMQYEWAERAAGMDDHDLSAKHLSEAKRRLSGVSDWMTILDRYEEAKMPLTKALLEHYKGWHDELLRKVEHFHATAEA